MQSSVGEGDRPIIDVRDFTLSFASDARHNVIDGISFAVMPGRTLCVVGESGCGKSVMSLALMGLLGGTSAKVFRGSMHFAGQDLLSMTAKQRAQTSGDRMAMIWRDRSDCVTAPSCGAPPGRPSTLCIAPTAASKLAAADSDTKYGSSGRCCATNRATASDRAVFPTPPGPTTVTSRARSSKWRSVEISSSRPISNGPNGRLLPAQPSVGAGGGYAVSSRPGATR
jgi:ABC-type oligopeptide transport system ATPase subunit